MQCNGIQPKFNVNDYWNLKDRETKPNRKPFFLLLNT